MDSQDVFKKNVSRRAFLEKSLKSGMACTAGPALLGCLASCAGSRGIRVPGHMGSSDLNALIDGRFRRLSIAHLPTPFEFLDVLTSELGGPRIYVKRDDQTGLAFGGNKTRKAEFIVADALDKDADVLITWGGLQSNWCRQMVAATRMFGIRPVLVLTKKEGQPVEYGGNLLLDAIMGADIRIVEPEADREEVAHRIAREEKTAGHRPYVVSVGGSRTGGSMVEPLGAISYTKAFLEIYDDAQRRKIKVTHIVHATGSGGTQAGLVAGAKAVDERITITGISIGGDKASGQAGVAEIANLTFSALGLEGAVVPEEVVVFDDYVGGGYGILNPETAEAIFLIARKEGILLDPVYTGKAMAGMMDLVKKGYFTKDDSVVFIHTGGTPALFPYGKELLEYLEKGDFAHYMDFFRRV